MHDNPFTLMKAWYNNDESRWTKFTAWRDKNGLAIYEPGAEYRPDIRNKVASACLLGVRELVMPQEATWDFPHSEKRFSTVIWDMVLPTVNPVWRYGFLGGWGSFNDNVNINFGDILVMLDLAEAKWELMVS